MVPGDATFTPYIGSAKPNRIVQSPGGGRICLLKFSSSSDRYLFWLQAKAAYSANPARFSPKDLKCADIVNKLLSAEPPENLIDDLDQLWVEDDFDNSDDEDMEEDHGPPAPRLRANSSTGGAGSGATGGDFREEGEGPREGGADGARA